MSASLQDGVFFIRSRLHGKVLDVPGPNQQVVCTTRNTTRLENQLFEVKAGSYSGYYSITNVATGMVLDIERGQAGKQRLLAWRPKNVQNQMWCFSLVCSPATYCLLSASPGTVIDLTGSSQADNTPVISYPRHSGPNQQWELVSPSISIIRSIRAPQSAPQVVEKVVEKRVEVPKIVEKIVEVPKIVEKEKIVEKIVEVDKKDDGQLDELRGLLFLAMKGWEECRGGW